MILKRFLSSQSPTIASAALLIFVSGLGSRLLGLVRDRILAGMYGASRELDVYYAAFRIPDLVYTLLVMGALSAVFIPVFTAHLARSREDAERLASNAANALLFVLGITALLGMLFARPLMTIVAPGFGGEDLAEAARMSRIMFLSPVLLGLSSVASGVLQSFRVYGAFALSPMLYNIGIIAGALVLTKFFGLAGLAWGVVAGAALHLAVQAPSLKALGIRWRKALNFRDAGLREIIRLSLPRLFGMGAAQVNLWVLTALASALPAGAIAVFNLANNLQAVPVGVAAVAFATAAFPALSESWAKKNENEFFETFQKTFREIFFLIAPASVLFWLLRAQIVRVVLGAGKFSWEDTRLTAAGLAIFAVSIFAQGLILLFVRAFYARHDTKTPVICGVAAVAANIILALMLIPALEAGGALHGLVVRLLDLEGLSDIRILGIILSFTLAQMLQFLLLFLHVSRSVPQAQRAVLWRSLKLTVVLSLAIAPFVFMALRLFAALVPLETFWGVFAQGLGAGLVGILAYLALAYLAKMEELGILKDFALRRLFPPKAIIEEVPGTGDGKV